MVVIVLDYTCASGLHIMDVLDMHVFKCACVYVSVNESEEKEREHKKEIAILNVMQLTSHKFMSSFIQQNM